MKTIFSLVLFLTVLNIGAQEPFFPQYNEATDTWVYIDVSGKTVLEVSAKDLTDPMPFSDGMALALGKEWGKWGYLDTEGKWAIKPAFSTATDFLDGYALADNRVIDKKGKVVFAPEKGTYLMTKNFGGGFFNAIYGDSGYEGLINVKGESLCDFFDPASDGKIGFDRELNAYKCDQVFYSLEGRKILDLSKYDKVEPFSEGYAWAQIYGILDDTVGGFYLVDSKGNEILKLKEGYIPSSQVLNGTFTFEEDLKTYRYNVAEKRLMAYVEPDPENYSGHGYGYHYLLPNKALLMFSMEDVLIGFINASGKFFYKYPADY